MMALMLPLATLIHALISCPDQQLNQPYYTSITKQAKMTGLITYNNFSLSETPRLDGKIALITVPLPPP